MRHPYEELDELLRSLSPDERAAAHADIFADVVSSTGLDECSLAMRGAREELLGRAFEEAALAVTRDLRAGAETLDFDFAPRWISRLARSNARVLFCDADFEAGVRIAWSEGLPSARDGCSTFRSARLRVDVEAERRFMAFAGRARSRAARSCDRFGAVASQHEIDGERVRTSVRGQCGAIARLTAQRARCTKSAPAPCVVRAMPHCPGAT